jgi:alpha,alpha-trehalase
MKPTPSILSGIGASTASPELRHGIGAVRQYIIDNWPRCFVKDEPGKGFGGVDLPYPYAAPCIKGEGHFTFFFYWDTYFANIGLLRLGHAQIARDNIRNTLWLIKRQGYMPNHVGLDNRSQSPYLLRMVRDYLEVTGDESLLPEALDGLRQEYNFWMTARVTGTGLNQHGHHGTWKDCEEFARMNRVAQICPSEGKPIAEVRRIGAHYLAEAEATCDFTNRFDRRCLDFIQVDLNALLYEYELAFAEWGAAAGWNEQTLWRKRAEERVERMQSLLWDEERGLFLDYDLANGRRGSVPALTGLQTMAHGIATPEQARRMADNLPLFEREHGLAYTAETSDCRNYQWAYPISWVPLTCMTIEGLARYGFHEEARRIAATFVRTTVRLFEKTGKLWEKVDAETGEPAHAEYACAPLFDWTAGVFVLLTEEPAAPIQFK